MRIPGDNIHGEYRDRFWAIRFNCMGHPCGYVKLKDDEFTDISLGNTGAFDEHLDIHGGCTYFNNLDVKGERWVGFDTDHYCDDEETQTVEYVKGECKYIIDQLIVLRDEKKPASHAND